MLSAALASCGAGGNGTNQANVGAAERSAPLARLSLTTSAFQDGRAMPIQYTCDGTDRAPVLTWSDPPAGTRSFALVIDDPEAPGGSFRHWGVHGIPASARSIGGSQRTGIEVANDFGKPGYGGPCPPKGRGPHHYHFKLFALDTASLGLSAGAKVADVENAARKHAIAEGELIGTYERR